jgi:tetratricopeptide (TPR) repeat protein
MDEAKCFAQSCRRQRYMYVAEMYNGLGDDSSAMVWYQKALNLQPDLVAAHVNVSYIYMVQGNHAEAQNHVDRSIALDSNNVRALEAAGYLRLFLGNLKQAQKYFEKSVAASSLSDGPGVQLAYTLMKLGKGKEANQILDSTYKTYVGAVDVGEELTSNPMYAAYICSLQNDTTTSLQWIRRAVGMGYGDYRWAVIEPLLENVRQTRGFIELMDEIKIKVDKMRLRARTLEAQQTNS